MELQEIRHLLELARIKLSPKEEEKIASDLERILDYVKQLQSLDTKEVEPMTGGTILKNICRVDKEENKEDFSDKLKKAAPRLRDNYFEVPPVM